MARAFVTGVNGFIGSHLAFELLRRGDEVTGLVRPTSDLRAVLPLFERYGSRLRLTEGDLRTGAGLEAGLEGVDYVYHLAAVVMGVSADEFRSAIVTGTRNLLDAVERVARPRLKRFLYFSSQAATGPQPSATPIDETVVLKPVSWYGTAKRDAEEVVRGFGARGIPFTIIRPVGVYGEREKDISGGTFGLVAAGLQPRVGFKKKVVSMVYVGDVVDLAITAAQAPNGEGKVYFAADRRPITQVELVAGIADAMNQKVRIPMPTPAFLLPVVAQISEVVHAFTRERPALTRDKAREAGHQFWAAIPAAAGADFGWQAKTTLVEGMRRAVADWRTRKETAGRVTDEPFRERAIRAYLIATLLGAVNEIVAEIGHWYEFDPKWLIFPVIAAYGVAFGGWALTSARWGYVVQFLGGAVIFMAAELSNYFWLHFWEFAPEPFGGLPVPWVRALVLAVPIGLLPVVTNLISCAIYRYRLRVG
jgi:nucleoside-diphosphate-sugar epimerase